VNSVLKEEEPKEGYKLVQHQAGHFWGALSQKKEGRREKIR